MDVKQRGTVIRYKLRVPSHGRLRGTAKGKKYDLSLDNIDAIIRKIPKTQRPDASLKGPQPKCCHEA